MNQQGNASCHSAKMTVLYVSNHFSFVMKWPALFPGIENISGMIAKHVYAGNNQYYTLEELKLATMNMWEKIPQSLIFKLANLVIDDSAIQPLKTKDATI